MGYFAIGTFISFFLIWAHAFIVLRLEFNRIVDLIEAHDKGLWESLGKPSRLSVLYVEERPVFLFFGPSKKLFAKLQRSKFEDLSHLPGIQRHLDRFRRVHIFTILSLCSIGLAWYAFLFLSMFSQECDCPDVPILGNFPNGD